jgi:HSP20 family protein
MTKLIRRNQTSDTTSSATAQGSVHRGLDPFSMVENLLGWDPWHSERNTGLRASLFYPRVDVCESESGYLFRADLPGIREENLDISLAGNMLTLSGHRDADYQVNSDRYHVAERTHGQFSRSFALPDGADAESVKADLVDGVLTVRIAKKPDLQPRKVAISRGNSAKA